MPLDFDEAQLTETRVVISGREFDRWIIGRAADSVRAYVMHMAPPRFTAKYHDSAGFGYEAEWETAGSTFTVDNVEFYDILWTDPPPASAQAFQDLLQSAREAVRRHARQGSRQAVRHGRFAGNA